MQELMIHQQLRKGYIRAVITMALMVFVAFVICFQAARSGNLQVITYTVVGVTIAIFIGLGILIVKVFLPSLQSTKEIEEKLMQSNAQLRKRDEELRKQVEQQVRLSEQMVMAQRQTEERNRNLRQSEQRLIAVAERQAGENRELTLAKKQAEEAKEQLQVALQETRNSQILLKETMRISKMGAWEFDVPSQSFKLSEEYLRVVGYEEEQGIKEVTFADWINNFVAAESLEYVKREFQVVLTARNPNFQKEVEYNLRHAKTGKSLIINSTVRVSFNEAGELIKIKGSIQDITERKKAEEQVKRLSLVASKTNNGVIITNQDRVIEWVNEGFVRISGYSLVDFIGKNLEEILQNTNTDAQHITKVREGLLSKRPFTQEIYTLHKSGRPYWLSLNITPVLDANGRVEKYIVIETDITERKQQEELLQKQNEKLAATDAEMRQALEAQLEASEKLFLAKKQADQSNSKMKKALADLRELQNQIVLAEKLRGNEIKKDDIQLANTYFDIDLSYIEQLKAKGLPVPAKEIERLKALYSYDILDTPREEEFDMIARIASYICGTEIALIGLVDKERQWFKSSIGLDVKQIDRGQSFCQYTLMGEQTMEVQDLLQDERFKDNPYVNSAGKAMRFYAGAPLSTEDGLHIGTLCVINSTPMQLNEQQKRLLRDLSEIVMARLEAIRQKQLLAVVNNQVVEAFEKVKKSESETRLLAEKQLEVNEKLMMAEEKMKEAFEAEKIQRMELNRTVEALKEAQTQLVHNEKMASLGQLTAGIAHEINNPINFVYNGIDTLKLSLDDLIEIVEKYQAVETAPDQQAALEEVKALKSELDYEELLEDINYLVGDIKKGAIRTMEIVKGLRVFSRLDEEEKKKASISECLDSTLVLLNTKLKGKVEVKRFYDESMPEINCYPGQLNQVFMNILNNAIQAFPEDKKDAQIDIYTENLQENIVIRIKDNGVGMNEQVQRRIFEPFFTTKPVGVGTGLGLSISFGIIEKHNGNIYVNSEEGKGTEFVIQLPKNLN